MQVFVADDIGRETMTGVTVPAELGDIVNDIVMGCDKPENDTYRKTDKHIVYFNYKTTCIQ